MYSQHAPGQGGVYPSMQWAGECLPRGCVPGGCRDVCTRVVSAKGGCLPRDWCLPTGVVCRGVVHPSDTTGYGQQAGSMHLTGNAFFSLNVFTEFSEFSDKLFVITVKGFEPDTTCVRHQDASTATARHM